MKKLTSRTELFPMKDPIPTYEPLKPIHKKAVPDFKRYTNRKDIIEDVPKNPDYYDFNKILTGEMTLSDYRKPKGLVPIEKITARDLLSSTLNKSTLEERRENFSFVKYLPNSIKSKMTLGSRASLAATTCSNGRSSRKRTPRNRERESYTAL